MAFEEISYCTLSGNKGVWDLHMDATGTYLYTLDNSSGGPYYIRKIRCSDMQIVDTIEYSSTLTAFTFVAGIDNTNGYLYVITRKRPCTMRKIDLATFTEVSNNVLTYITGSNNMAVDETNQVGYWSRSAYNQILKIDLTTLTDTVSSDITSSGCAAFYNGGIFFNGYSYWGSGLADYTGQCFLKLTPDFTPTIFKESDADLYDSYARFCIDEGRNYLYAILQYQGGGKFFKINLSTFSISSSVFLPPIADNPHYGYYGLAYDPTNQIAYVTNWYKLIGGNYYPEIQLINCASMTVLTDQHLTLSQYGFGDRGCVIDATNRFGYFGGYGGGSGAHPSVIYKIGLYSTELPISSIYHKWHEPVVII